MLVFGLVRRETFGAGVDDEPGRTAGRVRQDGVVVGNAAVRDPLLAAVDVVADDLAISLDTIGDGLQRTEVTAGVGLGRAIGKEHAFVGDLAQPVLLLLFSGAEGDRVAA